MKFILKSSRATKNLAARLAGGIKRSARSKKSFVIGLVGDLGAGKTTFIQGFAKKFHVQHRILSPSFLIFRNYRLSESVYKKSGFRSLYHVDFYRVKDKKELGVIGFKKILENPENIVLVEWADKIPDVLGQAAINLTFKHGKSENKRIVNLGSKSNA